MLNTRCAFLSEHSKFHPSFDQSVFAHVLTNTH
jgi:hypothetical protein